MCECRWLKSIVSDGYNVILCPEGNRLRSAGYISQALLTHVWNAAADTERRVIQSTPLTLAAQPPPQPANLTPMTVLTTPEGTCDENLRKCFPGTTLSTGIVRGFQAAWDLFLPPPGPKTGTLSWWARELSVTRESLLQGWIPYVGCLYRYRWDSSARSIALEPVAP